MKDQSILKSSMSPERLSAYRRAFAGVRTSELRAIVEGKRSTGLSEDALAAIRLVLAGRAAGPSAAMHLPEPPEIKQSLPPAEPSLTSPYIPIASKRPSGVGGWLLFFCVCLTITGPLYSLWRMVANWGASGPAFARFPILKDAVICENFGIGLLVLYGMLVGWAIWSGHLKGRELAKRYLRIRLFGQLGVAFIGATVVCFVHPELLANVLASVFVGVFGELVVFGIWWSYFQNSVRVVNTYGPLNSRPLSTNTTPPTNHRAPTRQLPVSSIRKLLVRTCAVFAGVIAVLAVPATRDELAWLRVSNNENVADEQAYFHAWPAGRHAAEAAARIDRHEWAVAAGLDSVKGYQSYLRGLPEGEHVAEAEARIEALKWEAAVAANHTKGFRDFLREYPDSQYVGEARLQIDALVRQQALEAAQRVRRVRSQLTDICVAEGAVGDSTGRDWQNACGSLKIALEDKLKPGAKIHVAAGLIQDSISIPDNIHLICGYGRDAQGRTELDPRTHKVFLMPPANGVRSLSIGRGCLLSGLWLGQLTRSSAGAMGIKTEDNVYTFCTSVNGPAKLELGGAAIRLELEEAAQMDEYEPRSRQFTTTIRARSLRIEKVGDELIGKSLGAGGNMRIEKAEPHGSAPLDRAPF